jgi:hypothetical protein
MAQYISHGFGEFRPARHAWQAVLQPETQVFNQLPTSLLTNRSAHIRRLATDIGLDGVEFGDTCQHLGRKHILRRCEPDARA